MALISDIRRRGGLIITLMVLSLAGFMLMDMSKQSSLLGGSNGSSLGSVSGTSFEAKAFDDHFQTLYGNASGQDVYSKREQLWNYYVENAIVSSEAEKVGLGVGSGELTELQFGQRMSPVMQRFLQENNLDQNWLGQIKQAIAANNLPENVKKLWSVKEKEIIKDRLQTKLGNLAQKAIYTPKWQLDMLTADAAQQVDFNFVKVAFDQVPDAEVKVTDADLQKYLDENPARYKVAEEMRTMSFVSWNVTPTAADSAATMKRLTDVQAEFGTTTDDSTFLMRNNGFFGPGFVKKDALSPAAAELISSAGVGQVVGPYIDQKALYLAKITDRQTLPDSVKVRHILISVNASQTDAVAKAKADSILAVVKAAGGANFTQLAAQFNEDGGSKQTGGEYTFSSSQTLFPEFYEYCFKTGKVGEYAVIKTAQGGYHVINLMGFRGASSPMYKIAYLREALSPSDATVRAAEDVANKFLAANRDLASLEKAAKEKGINVQNSGPVNSAAYNVAGLGQGSTAREMVRWAFGDDAKIGKVAPKVYAYEDTQDGYITQLAVSALKSIMKPGTPNIADIREQIEPIVKNKLKGEKLKAKITGTDLGAIAAQFNTKIDTARQVSFVSPFVPGLGQEPLVVAAVTATDLNKTTSAIVGETGVFVAQVTQKVANAASAQVDPAMMKTQMTMQARGQVRGRLMPALRKAANVSDNRKNFF